MTNSVVTHRCFWNLLLSMKRTPPPSHPQNQQDDNKQLRCSSSSLGAKLVVPLHIYKTNKMTMNNYVNFGHLLQNMNRTMNLACHSLLRLQKTTWRWQVVQLFVVIFWRMFQNIKQHNNDKQLCYSSSGLGACSKTWKRWRT